MAELPRFSGRARSSQTGPCLVHLFSRSPFTKQGKRPLALRRSNSMLRRQTPWTVDFSRPVGRNTVSLREGGVVAAERIGSRSRRCWRRWTGDRRRRHRHRVDQGRRLRSRPGGSSLRASRPTPTDRMPTGGEYDPDTIFDTALAVLAEVARAARRPPGGGDRGDQRRRELRADRRGGQGARAEHRLVRPADGPGCRASSKARSAPTGCSRSPASGVEFNFTLVKLLWMRRHWPEAFARGAARDADGGLDRLSAVGRRRHRPDACRPHAVLRHHGQRLVGGDAGADRSRHGFPGAGRWSAGPRSDR